MDFKDYYSTLGVSKAATQKEIKAAFRKLARKHHPDVNPGDKSAETRFKDLNEANEVLGDPDKRRKYDELGSNWRQYEQAPPGPAAARSRAMTENEMRDMFGSASPFSDFFQTFFGGSTGFEEPSRGRGGRGARAARAGDDVEHEIELGLEDAFHGTMRRLTLTHDGIARTVDVRIPAGVGDGSRVRISGEGGHGSGGAKSGDLYLRIRLAGHPRFERKGHDLYTRVAITLTTAVLGGEAEVTTLGGKSLRLKIPETTQNAQVFRLKGHGMPASGKSPHGDLYATVDIQMPKTLTPEQRALFEALQKMEQAS